MDRIMAEKDNVKRITLQVVDRLTPGETVWSADVRGFGIRCRKQSKTYILKTRIKGRVRWFSIGQHGSPWNPEMARREAFRILGDIASGGDPAGIRDANRANPTVANLVGRFIEEHVVQNRRPGTLAGYRSMAKQHLVPAFGRHKVSDVTRTDMTRFHHSLRATPYAANRALAFSSSFFSWAERHGYREGNPCRGVPRFKEKARERYLNVEEMACLEKALIESEKAGEHPSAINLVRLLIFTGARCQEIAGAQWHQVDLAGGRLHLNESKTGKKTIQLPAPAVEILKILPRSHKNDYILPGMKAGSPLIGLHRIWNRIRVRAGLPDLRLHDLRHSFASVAASSGHSLHILGRALGHSRPQTTARYAHLADDPVHAIVEDTAMRIASAMKKGGAIDLALVPS